MHALDLTHAAGSPCMSKCTADHRALKADPSLWITLELIGVQVIEADGDEPEERLELRNCNCGSTLCLKVVA